MRAIGSFLATMDGHAVFVRLTACSASRRMKPTYSPFLKSYGGAAMIRSLGTICEAHGGPP
jgi:hypothetical protein